MSGVGVCVTLLCVPGRDERGYNLWHNAAKRGYYTLQGRRNHLTYLTRPSSQAPDPDGARMPGDPFGADGGLLSQAEILRMRGRAGGGRCPTVWYGTLSLYGDGAPAMTRDAFRRLTASVFPGFLSKEGLDPSNVDLICVAHTADATDAHMHFLFWEKERMHDAGGRLTYTPAADVWRNRDDLRAAAEGYLSDGRNLASCSHGDMLLSLAASARGGRSMCREGELERLLLRLADKNAGRKRDDVTVDEEDRKDIAAAMYLSDGGVRESSDCLEGASERVLAEARRAHDAAAEAETRRALERVDDDTDEFLRDTAFRIACTLPGVRPKDAEGNEIGSNGSFPARWKRARVCRKRRAALFGRFREEYPERYAKAAREALGDVRFAEEMLREREAGWAAYDAAGAGKDGKDAPREETHEEEEVKSR